MRKELIVLFIILSFLSIPNLIHLCKSYTELNYDNQIQLAWQYSASIGQFPYKHIFFPYYGFVTYLKGQNLFFSIIYFFLTPFLLTFFYFIIHTIFRDRLFSYFSVFILFLFAFTITGFEIFSRYGVLVFFACSHAFILFSHKIKSQRKIILSAGVLNGLAFPFFNDQAIYGFVLFIAMLTTDKVLRNGFKKENKFLFDLIIFVLCFLVGIMPFLTYLVTNHYFSYFFFSLFELSDISKFAKTPFFHSFATVDNVFTFVSLFLTISFIIYRLVYLRKKATLNSYIQIALVFALILLEQKNIIRSIDIQLTFIGLLLYIFLFYELKTVLKTYKISDIKIFIYYINIVIIILFFIGLRPADAVKNPEQCMYKNGKLTIKNIEKYEKVKRVAESIKGFNGKIFSYPGDTIFYVVFEQPMPYYPSSFEASAQIAQNKTIEYIEKNNIKYVVYNTKNYAIQDEVPNYIRSPILHSYIITNYFPKVSSGDFLILEKKVDEKDFLNDPILDSLNEYKKTFLKVDLGNIPRSEGLYKKKNLPSEVSKKNIVTKSVIELNKELSLKNVSSDNKFLIIEFKKSLKKKHKSTLRIKTKDSLETAVKFYSCNNTSPCLINLSRLPIFYKTRLIKEISIKNNEVKGVNFFEISDESIFW